MAVPFLRQLARGLAAVVLLIGLFGSYLKSPLSSGRTRTYLANTAVFENSKAGNRSRFQYSLDGDESDELVPGDEVACIPAGHPHTFWNADKSRDLEIEYVVTPPGNMLPFFRTFCGLAQDSHGGTLDNVNPLQLLVTFKHAGMAMNIMPKPVWLMVYYVFVPILERFFKPFYPEYSGMIS